MTCALPRTDPSVGCRRQDTGRGGIDDVVDQYVDDHVDDDVAVLSLVGGTEHGHVRVHSLAAEVAVGDGSAVIFADGKIRLVGRPYGN